EFEEEPEDVPEKEPEEEEEEFEEDPDEGDDEEEEIVHPATPRQSAPIIHQSPPKRIFEVGGTSNASAHDPALEYGSSDDDSIVDPRILSRS
nr:hypothetical protein [Tanacetum cinerariifolium]